MFFTEKDMNQDMLKGLIYKRNWLRDHPDPLRKDQGVIMHGKVVTIKDLEYQIEQLQKILEQQ